LWAFCLNVFFLFQIGIELEVSAFIDCQPMEAYILSEEHEMVARYFNPIARAEQKDASRREDSRQLRSGLASAWDLRQRNSMFAEVDLSASSVILPPNRH